jgi:hypothetical protein
LIARETINLLRLETRIIYYLLVEIKKKILKINLKMPFRGTTRGGRGGRGRGRGRGGSSRSSAATTTTTAPATVGGKPKKFVKRNQLKNKKPRGAAIHKSKTAAVEEQNLNLDVNVDATEYFSKNATFDQHYQAQTTNCDKYTATLMAFEDYSIEVIPNARARSLAAAFARRDKTLIEYLLKHNKQYGFVDVLKSVNILDSKREAAAIEKKITRNTKTGSVMKPRKLGKLRNDVNNLKKIQPTIGTCSGALAKWVKRWVRKFTSTELEYFALCLPTEPWKKLANIVHLNPSKDFPNAPWFLPFCFGQDPPKDSKLDKCRNISKDNVNDLIREFDLPYSFIRKYASHLNEASKVKLAESQDKLDTILWWYEDLACSKVDDIVKQRLKRGDRVSLGYGKLMERLLMFRDLKTGDYKDPTSLYSHLIPIAEANLTNFKSTIASPVVVIGDASGSMSVAIRTATIISSLLTAICSAKLTFFNTMDFQAKVDPKTINEVLDVAYSTRADGGTAPAASLVPYFDEKKVVKTFIMVTDEEENEDGVTADGRRWRFFELFMEYRKLVYPASLIFVSFLGSQHSQGQMYGQFVRENVTDVLQFKFAGVKPDLTKLDSILGSICSKSSQTFSGHVEKLESDIKTNGLIKAFENLTSNAPVSYDTEKSFNTF